MKPWLRTSSSSPRTRRPPPRRSSSPRDRRWLRRTGRCGSAWPCGADYSRRSSIQSACDAHSSRPSESNRAQAAWCLRPSISSGHDDDRVPLADDHRAAEPRREPGQHHRRAGGEVGHRRAGGAVERRPDALRPHVAGAVVERLVGRPLGREPAGFEPAGEQPHAVSGRPLRAAHEAGGEGVVAAPALAARVGRRGRRVGRDRVGHVEQQLRGLALGHQRRRRRAAPRARRRARPRAVCRSAAAGAATRSPPRRRPAPPPARRCSRRWPRPGGPLKRLGMLTAVRHRLRGAGEASTRARRAGRRRSGSRARAGGRGGGRFGPARRR